MALTHPRLPRCRLQILDDQTRDGHPFRMREYEDTWARQDTSIKNIVARLAGLASKISGKH
ncbi:MAG: hypothetical protein QOJ15_3870 [Bradyrhizobium sp.]|nr:hypothetical protein [Bradyrhizobium sp.]